MELVTTQRFLDTLYESYNRRECIHPDPLEFLHGYEDFRDREIVAFVAASLAYGRVDQILRSVSKVLKAMVPGPFAFLKDNSKQAIFHTYSGFKHRFTDARKLSFMLVGVKELVAEYGSLQSCFCEGINSEDDIIRPMSAFVAKLQGCVGERLDHLVPSPVKGSACKRLNLFLRWMVRCDDVDPGGWSGIPPSKLLVPLDVHMHRIARYLNMTRRKQADMKTVMEVTEGFRAIAPSDPVKYDFCLTRLGIRGDGHTSPLGGDNGIGPGKFRPGWRD